METWSRMIENSCSDIGTINVSYYYYHYNYDRHYIEGVYTVILFHGSHPSGAVGDRIIIAFDYMYSGK